MKKLGEYKDNAKYKWNKEWMGMGLAFVALTAP
jgi:hypothetical protein